MCIRDRANSLFRSAERYAARVTTHFVVVSAAMMGQYLAAGIGRPDQYTRIFSGFPLEPFLTTTNDLQLRARLGLTADDIVVGKIARLCALKGHDQLLAIARSLTSSCPRVKLLLIGDGPWRDRLKTQVRALGLEKQVIFTGLVPPADVPRLVGIMDVLVPVSYTHLSCYQRWSRSSAAGCARPARATWWTSFAAWGSLASNWARESSHSSASNWTAWRFRRHAATRRRAGGRTAIL